MPAIYVHSLFGSPNDHELLTETGRGRSLNRHKFTDVAALRARLADPSSREAKVMAGLRAMAEIRSSHPAFYPEAAQRLLDSPSGVVAIARTAADGSEACVVVNLGAEAVTFAPPGPWVGADAEALPPWSARWLLGVG